MATQKEVEAIEAILQRWADNKGVGSYVSADEKTELAIEIIEKIEQVNQEKTR